MRKRGIYAFFGYDLPVEESLRAVSAAGFDAVSLWSGEYDGGLSLARQAALPRPTAVSIHNDADMLRQFSRGNHFHGRRLF